MLNVIFVRDVVEINVTKLSNAFVYKINVPFYSGTKLCFSNWLLYYAKHNCAAFFVCIHFHSLHNMRSIF